MRGQYMYGEVSTPAGSPNDKQAVSFLVTPESLACYDAGMKYGVEPGTFTMMVGSSSRDKDLQTLRLTVN